MKKPTRGKPIERRNGEEGFAWEGIVTKVDPAASPPHRPRDLVNIRHQGGDLISRPSFRGDGGYIPLTPLHDVETPDAVENPPFEVVDAFRWTPHWLGDHNNSAGVRLWLVAEASVANGFATLGFLDTDADRAFQVVALIRQQTPGYALPVEKFNNEFYFGDFSGLRKLYLVPSIEGASQPPVETTKLADEVILSYPGYRTGALQEHEGLLFFTLVAGPSFGEVYSWDGLTASQEFVMTNSGAAGSVMATYKDTLVVAVRDYVAVGQGALLVRDATGAWTTHTIGGFNVSRYPGAMQEYGPLLYICDGGTILWTWDGATLSSVHALPVGGGSLNVCTKLSGRLYFPWVETVGGTSELGYVDSDDAAPFTDFGTRSALRIDGLAAQSIAQYRGRLWIAYDDSSNVLMWHSQQFMPFDGWQETNTPIAFHELGSNFSSSPVTNMRTL